MKLCPLPRVVRESCSIWWWVGASWCAWERKEKMLFLLCPELLWSCPLTALNCSIEPDFDQLQANPVCGKAIPLIFHKRNSPSYFGCHKLRSSTLWKNYSCWLVRAIFFHHCNMAPKNKENVCPDGISQRLVTKKRSKVGISQSDLGWVP